METYNVICVSVGEDCWTKMYREKEIDRVRAVESERNAFRQLKKFSFLSAVTAVVVAF